MTLLERILAAFKPKKQEAPAQEESQQAEQEQAVVEQEAAPEAQAPVVDEAKVAEMTQAVEAFVYDSELAAELAPVFVAMSAVEGFDKVMELFAAKEKQIEALNVGSEEQKSTPEVQEKPVEEKPKAKSATDILRERANAQTQSK